MTEETIKAIKIIQQERMDLSIRKSTDYSGTMDNIGITGLQGIAIRILDKAARLHNLIMRETTIQVTDESLEDTLMDLGNYSDYGVCLFRNKWKN